MSEKNQKGNVSNIQVFEDSCCPDPSQISCVDVDSRNLSDCPNAPINPSGITDGVIAKIPVVLAELKVRFFVNAMIDLPESALEIKDIKKKIKVTQCMLLQPTNILFIKGFVRKNIDYSTRTCSNLEGVCGDLRHCTIDVPFECTTPVNFYRLPQNPILNERDEFQYLKKERLPRETFAEKDRLMSGDLSEFNQVSTEYFNELPFCELISSRIVEFDEFINRIQPEDIEIPFEERFFSQIEEKMVIELKLKVLQKRQVKISRVCRNDILEDTDITSIEE